LTGGKGLDHAIDIGGSGTIFQSLNAVRQGGLVSMIRNLTANVKKEGEGAGAKAMRGVFGAKKKVWESLLKFVEEKVVPYIGMEFGWEEAKEAFELLGRRESVGRILVRVKNDGRRGGIELRM
jgi:NADPH:quinone reductase-like Zn-dependent oxidoreductase